MTELQVILDEGGNPAFAVIPWREYERLATANGEASLSDEELYDRAVREGEESFPIAVVDRLLVGENAVRVYRGYHGITQKQLAETIGVKAGYLSQIEKGRRTGSVEILAAIAEALRVDVDALA